MIQRLDHIGIAVVDLDVAVARYTVLMGRAPDHIEDVPSENVRTAFFKTGDTQIELLAPTSPESAVAKFIAKRGEGVHHIAFAVKGFDAAIGRYQKEGFQLVGDTSRKGANGTRVAFLHPKSTFGTLIELVELKA